MHSNVWKLVPSTLLLLAVAAQANAQDAAAVLMSREGDVAIVRSGGSSEKALFGANLRAGDELRTGDASSADVLFATGQSIHLGPGSNITIQGAPQTGQDSADRSFGTATRFLQLKESRGTSSYTGLRSAGKNSALRAVAPCQTSVRSVQPVFRWKAPKDAGELALVVYHDGGELWRSTVEGATELRYPDDAPALEPGVPYSWTLESTDPLRFPPLRAPASFFEVLSLESSAEVDRALAAMENSELSASGRALVQAGTFYDYELFADAIDATEVALEESGGEEELRAILANLYLETGRTEDAIAVYDGLLDAN